MGQTCSATGCVIKKTRKSFNITNKVSVLTCRSTTTAHPVEIHTFDIYNDVAKSHLGLEQRKCTINMFGSVYYPDKCSNVDISAVILTVCIEVLPKKTKALSEKQLSKCIPGVIKGPSIDWGMFRITRQVPKYLPPSLSEGITTIYGILEPDSPSSSDIYLNGIIANEKVNINTYIANDEYPSPQDVSRLEYSIKKSEKKKKRKKRSGAKPGTPKVSNVSNNTVKAKERERKQSTVRIGSVLSDCHSHEVRTSQQSLCQTTRSNKRRDTPVSSHLTAPVLGTPKVSNVSNNTVKAKERERKPSTVRIGSVLSYCHSHEVRTSQQSLCQTTRSNKRRDTPVTYHLTAPVLVNKRRVSSLACLEESTE